MNKRLLAVLLSASMVFSSLTMPVMADEDTPDAVETVESTTDNLEDEDSDDVESSEDESNESSEEEKHDSSDENNDEEKKDDEKMGGYN